MWSLEFPIIYNLLLDRRLSYLLAVPVEILHRCCISPISAVEMHVDYIIWFRAILSSWAVALFQSTVSVDIDTQFQYPWRGNLSFQRMCVWWAMSWSHRFVSVEKQSWMTCLILVRLLCPQNTMSKSQMRNYPIYYRDRLSCVYVYWIDKLFRHGDPLLIYKAKQK